MKTYHQVFLKVSIWIGIAMLLSVARVWSAEPSIGRLSFWMSSDRVSAFDVAYEREIVLILDRHGFRSSSERPRATVDSVFARLFEADDPSF